VRQLSSSTLFAGRAAEALTEHRALLKAIKARDGDKAELAAREHRRKTLDARRRMLRAQKLEEAQPESGPASKRRRSSK
jgi:DNA-binding FadR family transcriptional regulator